MLRVSSLRLKASSLFKRATRQPVWFQLFLFLIALSPLPFGSNRPWASDLAGVLTSVILLGLTATLIMKPVAFNEAWPRKRMATSLGLVTLVLCWAFFQTVSWAPAPWHHPLWHSVTAQGAGAITLTPGLFQETCVRMLTSVGCFLIAFFAAQEPRRAQRVMRLIVYAGLFYAVYGLIVHAFGSRTILWFDKWVYEGFLTSTFVGKNAYATYAGLGFIASLALLWEHLKNTPLRDKHLAKATRLGAWLDQFSLRDGFMCLTPLLIMGALVLTGSRAGMFSTLCGTGVFAVALAINRRWSWRSLSLLLGVGFALVLIAVLIGGDALVLRSVDQKLEGDATVRLTAYRLVEQAIADNPWFGFGLGSFDQAFKIYRDSSVDLWFQHAHNDYLELAMDLGIPAAVAMIGALLLMVSCCVQAVWTRKRNAIYALVGLGASVLVGVHALTDFSLQIPAVSITYATLLGLGVGQSWSSRGRTA